MDGRPTPPAPLRERLLLTAASEAYAPSLLALLGSLTLHGPSHPPVRVYDIGLAPSSRETLERHGVEVVAVPAFCPHWRRHFTWKPWCWADAPARDVLWIDAGVVVLDTLDEVFAALERTGYFVLPTYHLLTENASEVACRGCGVPPGFRAGKMTLSAGFVGFRKEGPVAAVLEEALSVASVEEHIAASEPMHRHDQAILSLLLHKHLGALVLSDGVVYGGWKSPEQTPGQKVWVHRRTLLEDDRRHYAAHVATPGPARRPVPPPTPPTRRGLRAAWKSVFGPPERAIRHLLKGRRVREVRPYDGVRDA